MFTIAIRKHEQRKNTKEKGTGSIRWTKSPPSTSTEPRTCCTVEGYCKVLHSSPLLLRNPSDGKISGHSPTPKTSCGTDTTSTHGESLGVVF